MSQSEFETRMPTIVILGRPNVGKSTLFNRLSRTRRALVHNQPGVTRDRIEITTQWFYKGQRLRVRLIDTGGIGGKKFDEEIREQVRIALQHADLGLIVFDIQAGVTPADQEMIREIRREELGKKIPLIGVVNKVDEALHEDQLFDFYTLGLDPLVSISAEHGRGINDLQEKALALIQPELLESPSTEEMPEFSESVEPTEFTESEDKKKSSLPRIAIVGKPNAGKSTLLNVLAGEKRMITSPIAGTTIDAVDSLVRLKDKPYVFIDTAGIRRKSKTKKGVEVLSVVQARKALTRADIAILVIDGEEGPSDQDEKIGGLIQDSGCSAVLFVNKWDTQARNEEKGFDRKGAAEHLRKQMAFLGYAPLVFASAKYKRGLKNLPDLVDEILHQRELKIPTHEFTEFVRKETEVHNPRNAKIYYAHQTSSHPPSFVCHVNDPKKVHFSTHRHIVNAIRERWGFIGSPIRIKFSKSAKSPNKSRSPSK